MQENLIETWRIRSDDYSLQLEEPANRHCFRTRLAFRVGAKSVIYRAEST